MNENPENKYSSLFTIFYNESLVESQKSLSIYLSSSMTINKEHSIYYDIPKIIFQIKEGIDTKISYTLDYHDLIVLAKKLKYVFDLDDPYKKETNIAINKRNVKSNRNLVFKFYRNEDKEKNRIDVTVSNTSSLPSTLTIILYPDVVYSILAIFLCLKDTLISNIIYMSNLNFCNKITKDISNKINDINSSMKESFSLLTKRLSSINIESKVDSKLDLFEQNEITEDSNEDEPIQKKEIEEESTEDFTNDFSDFIKKSESEEVDLGDFDILKGNPFSKDEDEDEEEIKEKDIQLPINKFLKNCIGYDATALSGIKTLLHLVGDNNKTKDIYYEPIGYLLSLAGIDISEVEKFKKETPNYYKSQYFTLKYLKDCIRSYIEKKEIFNDKVIKYGSNYINKEDTPDLYRLSKSLLIAFCIYYQCYRKLSSYMKSGGSINKDILDIIETSFLCKVLFLPIVVSSELISLSEEELRNELEKVYDEFNKSGSFSKLQENCGKCISIEFKFTFDSLFSDIVNITSKINNSCLDSLQLDLDMNDSLQSVKDKISEFVNSNSPKNEDKENSSNVDKLKLFIKVLKSLEEDKSIIDDLNKSCRVYEDLKEFLRSKSNISDDVIRVKRIMDLNDSLNKVSEVLRKFREMDEDFDVTKSRVLQEENEYDEIKIDEDMAMSIIGGLRV